MKKRILKYIRSGISILLAAVFAACSSGDTVRYSNVNNDNVKISFSWWGNDERVIYTMDGVRRFEELFPEISVKCKYGVWVGYNKRQNIYMLSHDTPDVMQINYDWINTYSPDGEGFYDINKLKNYIDLSNFSEKDLSYGMSNGKLNALPIALNTHSLFLNKDIYDKYGLDIPKSWDDYFAAAKVMHPDGVYPLSMGDKPLFFFLLSYFEQTTGKDACDENGDLKLTEEDIKYMLTFYKKLYDENVVMPVRDSDYSSFSKGISAGNMRWISGAQTQYDGLFEKPVNIVVAPIPTVSGNMKTTEDLGWYVKPATMYAISSKTEHPQEAAQLVNFLLNSKDMAKLQKTEKGIPISSSAVKTLKEQGSLDNIDYKATEQMKDVEGKLKLMLPILEQEKIYKPFFREAAYYIYNERAEEETAKIIYNEFYKN